MEDFQIKLQARQLISEIEMNSTNKTCSKTVILNRGTKVKDLDKIINFAIKEKFIENKGNNVYLIKNSEVKIKEPEYYPFIEKSIKQLLEFNTKTKNSIFETQISSNTDSKIAGKWTRPDLIAISKRKYPYMPDYELDIITFEVKAPEDISVLAVFEALAHRSAASMSYVVFPTDVVKFQRPNDVYERIVYESAKYGIGIICINDLFDEKSASIVLEAQRFQMDNSRASEFLIAVVPKEKLHAFA